MRSVRRVCGGVFALLGVRDSTNVGLVCGLSVLSMAFASCFQEQGARRSKMSSNDQGASPCRGYACVLSSSLVRGEALDVILGESFAAVFLGETGALEGRLGGLSPGMIASVEKLAPELRVTFAADLYAGATSLFVPLFLRSDAENYLSVYEEVLLAARFGGPQAWSSWSGEMKVAWIDYAREMQRGLAAAGFVDFAEMYPGVSGAVDCIQELLGSGSMQDVLHSALQILGLECPAVKVQISVVCRLPLPALAVKGRSGEWLMLVGSDEGGRCGFLESVSHELIHVAIEEGGVGQGLLWRARVLAAELVAQCFAKEGYGLLGSSMEDIILNDVEHAFIFAASRYAAGQELGVSCLGDIPVLGQGEVQSMSRGDYRGGEIYMRAFQGVVECALSGVSGDESPENYRRRLSVSVKRLIGVIIDEY